MEDELLVLTLPNADEDPAVVAWDGWLNTDAAVVVLVPLCADWLNKPPPPPLWAGWPNREPAVPVDSCCLPNKAVVSVVLVAADEPKMDAPAFVVLVLSTACPNVDIIGAPVVAAVVAVDGLVLVADDGTLPPNADDPVTGCCVPPNTDPVLAWPPKTDVVLVPNKPAPD